MPIVWKSEDERREWFARNMHAPDKPISQYFLDARKAFEEMYGVFDVYNAEYHVPNDVYFDLLKMACDSALPIPFAASPSLSFYGVKVLTYRHLCKGACILVADGNEYHFEIPEQRKVKPTIDQIMARRTMEEPPFRQFEWLFQKLLRFIDWLRKMPIAILGSEKWTVIEQKSKEKTNGEQMATLAELFEGHDEQQQFCVPRPGKPPGNAGTTRR